MGIAEWSESYRAAIQATLAHQEAELSWTPPPEELLATGLPAALDALLERYRVAANEAAALAALTERINSSLMLDEVMEHVFVDFRALLPYQRIGVALLDESGTTA